MAWGGDFRSHRYPVRENREPSDARELREAREAREARDARRMAFVKVSRDMLPPASSLPPITSSQTSS